MQLDGDGIYVSPEALPGTAWNIIKIWDNNKFIKSNIQSADIVSGAIWPQHISPGGVTNPDIWNFQIMNHHIKNQSLTSVVFSSWINFVSGWWLFYYTNGVCQGSNWIIGIQNGNIICWPLPDLWTGGVGNCIEGQTPVIDESGNWSCQSILLWSTTDGDLHWDTINTGFTCTSWRDWCNECSIGNDGIVICSEAVQCPAEQLQYKCISWYTWYTKPDNWTIRPTPYSIAPWKDIWNSNQEIISSNGYTCTNWKDGCNECFIEVTNSPAWNFKSIICSESVQCSAGQTEYKCISGHQWYDGDVEWGVPPYSYPAGASIGKWKVWVWLTTPSETLTVNETARVDNGNGVWSSVYCHKTDSWVNANQYDVSSCAICESEGFVYNPKSNRCEKVICINDPLVWGTACWPANGETYPEAPIKDILCTAGTPSQVTLVQWGTGQTWQWGCSDEQWEMAYCSANYMTQNGKCGSANGMPANTTPTTNLCELWVASAVAGNGPWSWSCNGTDTIASCAAPKTQTPINGKCGSANGVPASTTPTTNLCELWSASVVAGNGPWSWSCNGLNGWSNSSCSASKVATPVAWACGSANGQATATAPIINLCSAGTSSAVAGNGPWSWSCNGLNGWSNSSCSANIIAAPIAGVCGTSNGQTLSSTPITNLCQNGIATTVVGNGPWSWSCQGVNGGTTASCSANKSNNPICGWYDHVYVKLTAEQQIQDDYTAWEQACTPSIQQYTKKRNCTYKFYSDINGSNPITVNNLSMSFNEQWRWYSYWYNNVINNIVSWNSYTTLCRQEEMADYPPAACNVPSEYTLWVINNTCVTVISQETSNTYGLCGSANWTTTSSVPTSNLCAVGTPSTVAGNGPWTWSCQWTNTTASCVANKTTNTINGACKTFSSPSYTACDQDGPFYHCTTYQWFSYQPGTNTSNGCVSWNYFDVADSNTYWTWECRGENWGTNAVCEADVQTPVGQYCDSYTEYAWWCW